jgi:predicted acetyltransferase
VDLEIRRVSPEEYERFLVTLESAFGHVPSEEEIRLERALVELDRTIGVFDGPDPVGSTAAYSMELTVPGGTVPMAGVTAVAVVPTHRRQGILTELMRRQMDELRDQEPVAGLWASEGSIYQRYGYGLAALHARFTIERTRTAFARPLPPDPGRLRLVQRERAMAGLPAVYDQLRPTVPGMLARTPTWWEHVFSDIEAARHGMGPLFFVLHESGGSPDGYLTYRTKDRWENGVPSGRAAVHELVALNPAAYGALWTYMLGLDLTAQITGWRRPADEPLLYMLAEPRRLQLGLHDALWLRLVDVPRAMEARRYAVEGRLVFEVRDDFCPWNEGRYELRGAPDGAEFVRSGAQPDLLVDAADLGAVYLGGTTFDRLERAGRVTAASPEALATGDELFRTARAPWCPHVF